MCKQGLKHKDTGEFIREEAFGPLTDFVKTAHFQDDSTSDDTSNFVKKAGFQDDSSSDNKFDDFDKSTPRTGRQLDMPFPFPHGGQDIGTVD